MKRPDGPTVFLRKALSSVGLMAKLSVMMWMPSPPITLTRAMIASASWGLALRITTLRPSLRVTFLRLNTLPTEGRTDMLPSLKPPVSGEEKSFNYRPDATKAPRRFPKDQEG